MYSENSTKMNSVEVLKKNWFLMAIVVFIIFAKIAPWIGQKGGPLYPEVTIKYIAVSVIFFNSGLSLRSEDLRAAVFHYRLHIFIQSFTFILIPTFTALLVKTLSWLQFNQYLTTGIRVVSCMPPPVSSAVIITKSIGGNEAGAIFNSAFGSFLGIVFTPVLLLLNVGVSGSIPILNIVKVLTVTVVIPLFAGQISRIYLKDWLEREKPPLGQIGSFMLLMIIYTTFCDTFSNDIVGIRLIDLALSVFIIFVLQLSLLYAIFVCSPSLGFTKEDIVALMFCSTHKSLTLGMPILKIIYAGEMSLPFLSIPLLIYHPTQILLGGFMVPLMKTWLHKLGSPAEGEHV